MGIFLETQRLILKTPELSDLDDLIALRTDPDVMQYINDGSIQTIEQVHEHLINFAPYFEKHGLGFFLAFEKETGRFIGQAGLFHVNFNDSQPDIEVAYRLHKKFWGKGYATELASALIQWGFKHLSIEKIIAFVHPENGSSRRVMEKSGMRYQGVVPYKHLQLPCYAAIRNRNEPFFSSKDVIELYDAMSQLQIDIWIDGGWGVDALLGEQTRMHQDLDIVIQEKDLKRFCVLLTMQGYTEVLQDDSCAWNFVLGDNKGHKVDIHVINFNVQGNGIYGPAERDVFYPAEALLSFGQIEGTTVRCLSAEYQVQSHRGYALKEKDFKDVFALCSRFNIPLPEEYQISGDTHA